MSRLNETYFNGRIDYNISPTQRLYVRYLKDIGELDAPDNTVTPRRILATNKPDNFVAVLNSTVSARSVNEFKVGLNRAPTTLSVLPGVPGWKGHSSTSAAVSFNRASMAVRSGVAAPGGTTRQSSAGNGRGSDYRGKTYTILDNFSYLAGNHQIKAGFEFRAIRIPLNQLGGVTYSIAI